VTASALAAWQWAGYARYHQTRINLLLHLVAVPLFIGSSAALAVGAWRLAPAWIVAALLGMAASVVVQGRGHRLEPVPPEPFAGPANFCARFFIEQWVTFPRFVLSGGWRRSFAAARHAPGASRGGSGNGAPAASR